MGSFPGYVQLSAVITRLRSELKKTALTAAAPRTFNASLLPTGGGYGLTLPSTDLPENWDGGSNPGGVIDLLCPIFEAWRFLDLDAGEQIEETHLSGSGFTWADIAGSTDVTTEVNWRGSGYMLVEQGSLGDSEENQFSGVRRAEDCFVRVYVRVPAGFGQGQGQLYCGILARVLGEIQNAAGVRADNAIGLGGNDFLQFGWVPEMGRIEEESGEWLGFVWEATCTRFYDLP